MKNKYSSRLLTILMLLAVVMLLGLMPQSSMVARAADDVTFTLKFIDNYYSHGNLTSTMQKQTKPQLSIVLEKIINETKTTVKDEEVTLSKNSNKYTVSQEYIDDDAAYELNITFNSCAEGYEYEGWYINTLCLYNGFQYVDGNVTYTVKDKTLTLSVPSGADLLSAAEKNIVPAIRKHGDKNCNITLDMTEWMNNSLYQDNTTNSIPGIKVTNTVTNEPAISRSYGAFISNLESKELCVNVAIDKEATYQVDITPISSSNEYYQLSGCQINGETIQFENNQGKIGNIDVSLSDSVITLTLSYEDFNDISIKPIFKSKDSSTDTSLTDTSLTLNTQSILTDSASTESLQLKLNYKIENTQDDTVALEGTFSNNDEENKFTLSGNKIDAEAPYRYIISLEELSNSDLEFSSWQIQSLTVNSFKTISGYIGYDATVDNSGKPTLTITVEHGKYFRDISVTCIVRAKSMLIPFTGGINQTGTITRLSTGKEYTRNTSELLDESHGEGNLMLPLYEINEDEYYTVTITQSTNQYFNYPTRNALIASISGTSYVSDWKINGKKIGEYTIDETDETREIYSISTYEGDESSEYYVGTSQIQLTVKGSFLQTCYNGDGLRIDAIVDEVSKETPNISVTAKREIENVKELSTEDEYGHALVVAEYVGSKEDKDIFTLKLNCVPGIPEQSISFKHWKLLTEDGTELTEQDIEVMDGTKNNRRYQIAIPQTYKNITAIAVFDEILPEFVDSIMTGNGVFLPIYVSPTSNDENLNQAGLLALSYDEYKNGYLEDVARSNSKSSIVIDSRVPFIENHSAVLSFLMKDLKGFTSPLEVSVYAGETTETNPLNTIVVTPSGQTPYGYIHIGIANMPKTEKVTVKVTLKNTSVTKTYDLDRTIESTPEVGSLKELYLNTLTTKSYYSSEYLLTKYYYPIYEEAIQNASTEKKEELIAKYKKTLENISNGIFEDGIGMQVAISVDNLENFDTPMCVATVPEGSTVQDAICAALEETSPGVWKFSMSGTWMNGYALTGGTGRKTDDVQSGGWMYSIYNTTSGGTVYSDFANWGVTEMPVVDGDGINISGKYERSNWALAFAQSYGEDIKEYESYKNLANNKDDEKEIELIHVLEKEIQDKKGVEKIRLLYTGFTGTVKEYVDAIEAISPVTLRGESATFDESKITLESGELIEEAYALQSQLTASELKRLTRNNGALLSMKNYYNLLKDGGIVTDKEYQKKIAKICTSMKAQTPAYGNEWNVFALARAGQLTATDEYTQTYLASLNTELANDGLKNMQPNDYEKVTLALTALGFDASAYKANDTTYNFVEKLLDSDSVENRGFTIVANALLALDSNNYESQNQTIRNEYVTYLLESQLEDGGWSTSEKGDADTTAMVIQALVPYQTKDGVSDALTKAVTFLQKNQNSIYGDFQNYSGDRCSETTAQVLIALTALNIDPTSKDWTTEYDANVISGLNIYYVEDGENIGYSHTEGNSINKDFTYQSLCALVAYDRYVSKNNALYDMTDAFSSISDCTVDLSSTTYTYDGTEQKPEVTVKNGETTLIKDTDYTVSYSNNTDVGIATVTITGKGSYMGEIQKTFTITKAEQTVTASVTPASVVVGETAQITANGQGTFTYKSSDTSIATVNKNGKVTAVSVGKATITVTASGNTNYKQATATCKITVTAKKVSATKVTLNVTKKTLNKGKTYTLKATVTPKDTTDTLKWSSSDSKIVKVDQTGKITAVKKGTATITVKTTSGKTATCKVTVNVPATKVALNVTKKALNKGKTYTLKATVTPKDTTDTLKWSSSDSKIVKVDQTGKITAIKKGTATITVRTTSGKTATCKVTVNVPATKVTLNVTKKTLNKGKTYTLKATVTPKDSTDTLTWSSSNPKVVKVSKKGKITAVKKGTATITVKTTSGKKATCKVTVK